MDREIPFDENAICDGCGCKGAYDFMGDFYCQKCTEKFYDTDCECDGDCECNIDYTDEVNE